MIEVRREGIWCSQVHHIMLYFMSIEELKAHKQML